MEVHIIEFENIPDQDNDDIKGCQKCLIACAMVVKFQKTYSSKKEI